MGEPMARCHNLVKIYESDRGSVQALRGIDLTVEAGSVTAVVGPSGSGKSSLLRILGAIDLPSAGEVAVGGVALANLSAGQRRRVRRTLIGFIGQRPAENLRPRIPIVEQVAGAARFRGSDGTAGRAALDALGMAGRAAHAPEQLSGGEQQRAAVARALAGSPALLIADEPTAELDAEATVALCASLRSLADDMRLASLIATHDPVVMSAADHVVMLRDGAIQSETHAGEERAVIDATGRLQLPPQVLEWFPGMRVVLEVDPDTRTVRIRPT